MKNYLILVLTGVLFAGVFNVLSYLRREGISRRFLLEAAAITILFGLLGLVFGIDLHPIAFLAILYVLTLRVRLLVDLGSAMARRGNLTVADKAFSIARRLWLDPAGALMVRLNQGACELQRKRPEDAIPIFQGVLREAETVRLGIKYRSACHYNLGIAFWQKNMVQEAERELEAVVDLWPASTMARKAEKALERLR
ncbi:MAG: tetratricopeptide repeat protein [Spirochaetes bacterium]|nr:tetratricopeptide repeat protein [Spirochaetota bacterium]